MTAPLVPKVPSDDRRLARFTEVVSLIFNSLFGQSYLRQTATGTFKVMTGANTSTLAPTVNDDITLGYEIGNVWVRTSTGKFYVCIDNTDGAAIWNGPY